MTSHFRHKPKRHLPVQPVSKVIIQNECQTENPITSYNPEKFVFHDSDDDEPIRHTAHSSFYNKKSKDQPDLMAKRRTFSR